MELITFVKNFIRTKNHNSKLNTDEEKVFLELVKKSDLNYQDENDNTALLSCCGSRQYQLAKKLIYYGADVNLENEDGDNALHLCCMDVALDEELVFLLIKKGINVNEINGNGENALLLVCDYSRNLPVTEAIIEKTNNIDFLDSIKQS